MDKHAESIVSNPASSASFWRVREPASWPTLPARLSYTVLRDIEACPRRWSFRRGEYPGTWSGKGFPPAVALGTMAGQVVHVALERILIAAGAALNDVPTDQDPSSVIVEGLRTLGGLSAIINAVIDGIGAELCANPRTRARESEFVNDLRRQIPNLRSRIQQFLSRVNPSDLRPRSHLISSESPGAGSGPRSPLEQGLHAEVSLVNDELSWFGKADLLRVGHANEPHSDEILDFKTGSAKPDHAFQVRIYAFLWARDTERNPKGRRARRLTVLYDSGPFDVSAPVADADLDSIAAEIGSRTVKVRAAVNEHPPATQPSRENCEWCDVRHMCGDYWSGKAVPSSMAGENSELNSVDIGVRIQHKQGAWSWLALVTECGALTQGVTVGDRVLLRARPHDEFFGSLFENGAQFRITNAQPIPPSDESAGLAVFSLTRSTEAFLRP